MGRMQIKATVILDLLQQLPSERQEYQLSTQGKKEPCIMYEILYKLKAKLPQVPHPIPEYTYRGAKTGC